MPAESTLLARWLARADDPRTAFHEARGVTTWSGAVDAAERVAAGLLGGRRSLEGERVAMLVSPGADFAAGFFGVLRAGGAVVVLSPLHPPPETRYFCDDAGVRTVLASADLAERASCLAPERSVVLIEDMVARARARLGPVPGERDAALQLYTSGTTGKPKGAVITHANLAVQQELLGEAWAWRESDVLLHVLPLHHMHGLAIALLSAVGSRRGHSLSALPSTPAPTWERHGAAPPS
jgi:malonyl-CoA/methylmalonyl-CoA synthetase